MNVIGPGPQKGNPPSQPQPAKIQKRMSQIRASTGKGINVFPFKGFGSLHSELHPGLALKWLLT